jgi:membrane protease YdiL (CAAX protease family)
MEQRSFKYVDRLKMSTGGKVWWILYPVLIYFGIQIAVGMVVGFIGAFQAMGDLAPLAMSDPEAFQEQYTAALTEMVEKMTMPMTWILTFACLAAFIPIFYRDIKKFALRPDKIVKTSALTWIAIPIVCLGWAFTFLGLNEIFAFSEVFPDMERNSALIQGQNPIAVLILVGILTPIMEEFFFRGLIFKRLRGVMGFIPAGLISALVFGVAHLTPPQIIYTGVLGFLFAYIYEKKGSIWLPVFAHFCVNFGLTGIEYVASASLKEVIGSPIAVFISFVIAAGGAVLFILSVKKIPPYEPPFIADPDLDAMAALENTPPVV